MGRTCVTMRTETSMGRVYEYKPLSGPRVTGKTPVSAGLRDYLVRRCPTARRKVFPEIPIDQLFSGSR
jgi:hypothetical protein